MSWTFTVWISCSNSLKMFANSWPSAFKFFSRLREQFFLTIVQNNFGNKIPFLRFSTVLFVSSLSWNEINIMKDVIIKTEKWIMFVIVYNDVFYTPGRCIYFLWSVCFSFYSIKKNQGHYKSSLVCYLSLVLRIYAKAKFYHTTTKAT